jgi:hypothetical protein
MREAEFRAWLERSNYAGNTVRTQLSQARRLREWYHYPARDALDLAVLDGACDRLRADGRPTQFLSAHHAARIEQASELRLL